MIVVDERGLRVHHRARYYVSGACLIGGFGLLLFGLVTHSQGLVEAALFVAFAFVVPFLFWPFTEYCPKCKAPARIRALPPSGTFDEIRCDDCGWRE